MLPESKPDPDPLSRLDAIWSGSAPSPGSRDLEDAPSAEVGLLRELVRYLLGDAVWVIFCIAFGAACVWAFSAVLSSREQAQQKQTVPFAYVTY